MSYIEQFNMQARNTSESVPNPNIINTDYLELNTDPRGFLNTRSVNHTDEGSFRDDFTGTALETALTGTLTFTNGSDLVSGSGTLFLTELNRDAYIKITAHSETFYTRVSDIIDDTNLILDGDYGGATASASAIKSMWKTTTAPSGSITVSSSEVLINIGTVNGERSTIEHSGDYLPYILNFKARLSQRIADQEAIIGFYDDISSITAQAVVVFDGILPNFIKFRTSSSDLSTEIEETPIFLQNIATSDNLQFDIDLVATQATLSVNGQVVAIHKEHIPSPYQVLEIGASIKNTGTTGSSTTLYLKYILFQNMNQVQVANSFSSVPIPVTIIPAITIYQVVQGQVATSATSTFAVRSTTYTEPSTNAQRSISSNNANDTSGGTGARTVKLVYLNSSGQGYFSEIITLNGITPVNTVATDICYIQSLEVLTVGSGNTNAGTLTLFASTGGGGGTILTIIPGFDDLLYAQFYVPVDKTAKVHALLQTHSLFHQVDEMCHCLKLMINSFVYFPIIYIFKSSIKNPDKLVGVAP